MRSQTRAFSFVEFLVCLALIAVLAAILVPNFVRARSRGALTSCKSNLKNLGTALELYSADNEGHYPLRLASLTPDYLRAMPTCPTAARDTYTRTYSLSRAPGFGCPVEHREAQGSECDKLLATVSLQLWRSYRAEDEQELACPLSGEAFYLKQVENYRYACGGGNHESVDIFGDYPAYHSLFGLQARP